MPQSIDPQRLNQLKNTLKHLAKTHKLNDVPRLMVEIHGFKATKAQYEKLYEDCGIRKNRSDQDWKILDGKLKSRKRKGLESDVFLDGQLMDRKKLRKEISRHPMSINEVLHQARAPSPQTPPGFDIHTPCDPPVFRSLFTSLPILIFQEPQFLSRLSESINDVESHTSSLVQAFRGISHHSGIGPTLPIIESLLPNSALLEEPSASALALRSAEDLSSLSSLNLTVYLASNNFPAEASAENIYLWLKDHGTTPVLDVLLSMKSTTAVAVAEKLFRLAVEAGDVPVVKYFLDAGLDPNDHVCTLEGIPDTLTPIQLACITRNTAMARELIKAGSTTDQPDAGWKSSALVLTISGIYSLEMTDKVVAVIDDSNIWEQLHKNFNAESTNKDQHGSYNLLNLVLTLLDAGSHVNPCKPLHSPISTRDLPSGIQSLFQDGHSPLTAAAKFRQSAIVSLLIEEGADVNFVTRNETSALQECLYSWEQMRLDVTPRSFYRRGWIFHGCANLLSVLNVARDLLDAKANADYCTFYNRAALAADPNIEKRNSYEDLSYDYIFSSLDLAVLSEEPDIVEVLLAAGSTVTQHSLTAAVEICNSETFDRLLSTGIRASKAVVQHAIRNVRYPWERWETSRILLCQQQDLETQRLATTRAIRHGDLDLLEFISTSGGATAAILENSPALVRAIEDCCSSFFINVLRWIFDTSYLHGCPVSQLLGCSIHSAVSLVDRNNTLNLVDLLLTAGANINATSEDLEFETALFVAVRKGDVILVEKLIIAGANVNAKSAKQETALLVAVEVRDQILIEKLLDAGAALNTSVNCPDCSLNLHYPSGDILVSAVAWGDMAVIKTLIERGAKVSEVGRGTYAGWRGGKQCRMPLTLAIQLRNLACVTYLISKGAAIESPPELFMSVTPLAAAIRAHDENSVRYLLGVGAQPGHPLALQDAVEDKKLLLLLLDKLKGCWTIPPRAQFGQLALFKAIWMGKKAIVEMILDSGIVDVNKCPSVSEIYASLPLTRAVSRNLTNAAFSQEATAGYQARFDYPLQFAVSQGDTDITQILLNHGADPDLFSSYGFGGNGIYSCETIGASIQMAVRLGNFELVRILLQHKASPDTITGHMPHTALQMAAKNGYKNIVNLLIEYGADINSPPAKDRGATALQFAAAGGYLGIVFVLLEHDVKVDALGAEIDGRTALEGAAEHGRIDTVQVLLNAGAEVHGEGKVQYERALNFASQNGHFATKRLLEEFQG